MTNSLFKHLFLWRSNKYTMLSQPYWSQVTLQHKHFPTMQHTHSEWRITGGACLISVCVCNRMSTCVTDTLVFTAQPNSCPALTSSTIQLAELMSQVAFHSKMLITLNYLLLPVKPFFTWIPFESNVPPIHIQMQKHSIEKWKSR